MYRCQTWPGVLSRTASSALCATVNEALNNVAYTCTGKTFCRTHAKCSLAHACSGTWHGLLQDGGEARRNATTVASSTVTRTEPLELNVGAIR